MKILVCLLIGVVFTNFSVYAQTDDKDKQEVYLGVGYGFDYGGVGWKAEFLPIKHFGVFGGVGYNFLSVGWNLGATYKILPGKKVSPNLMLFYGYNAVFVGADNYASQYEITSYGVTVGVNLDILIGSRGNKLSIGLFIPFRSSEFTDNYDKAKADPFLEIRNELPPIGFGIGYNFSL